MCKLIHRPLEDPDWATEPRQNHHSCHRHAGSHQSAGKASPSLLGLVYTVITDELPVGFVTTLVVIGGGRESVEQRGKELILIA